MKNTLFFFLIFGLSSCHYPQKIQVNPQFQKEDTHKVEAWRSDTLFDTVWYDAMMSSKENVKIRFVKSNVLQSFTLQKNSDAYLLTTKEELNSCDVIPTEVFTMNTSDIKKLPNGSYTPIKEILTHNKDKVIFLIVKDQRLYYSYKMQCKNNDWTWVAMNPYYKSLSDTISKILFIEKRKIFSVYVPNAFFGSSFYVYKENDQIITIQNNGVRKKFLDVLKSRNFIN